MPPASTARVAILTGASTGIGEALARALAAEGWRLGLTARRAELLQELAGKIQQAGGVAEVAPADVADRTAITAALATLTDRLGPVDLLIANAGVGKPTLLDPVNLDDVEQMIQVNLLGLIYSVSAVIPDMIRRRSGHLVGISSMAAYKGLPGESGYCASKAAVNTYLEGLRIQLREHGVTVTTVCPGFIATPMTAQNNFHMPWLMSADDAARRIVRALRRRPAVLNFPWQMTLLMKATQWLPDWFVGRQMRTYNENPPFPK